MDRSLEEAKLIEFSEDQEFDVSVDWQAEPICLHLIKENEPRLFESAYGSGEAVLKIYNGEVMASFDSFTIWTEQQIKISKLFLRAYMRYLEDFYRLNHPSPQPTLATCSK